MVDLGIHGETAAYDLDLRVTPLEPRLAETVGRLKTSRLGPPQAAKIRQFLSQPKSIQACALPCRSWSSCRSRSVGSKDSRTEHRADELSSMTMFLDHEEQRAIPQPFGNVSVALTAGRHTLVRKQVQEALAQALQSQLPDRQGLLAGVTAATAGLRTAPTVDVGGKNLNGPQSLQHFGSLWVQTQVAWLRCRAIEWARWAGVPSLAYSSAGVRSQPGQRRRVRDVSPRS